MDRHVSRDAGWIPAGGRLISTTELLRALRIGRSTLRRLRTRRDFPAPIQIGSGRRIIHRWIAAEIDQWIAARQIEVHL